MSDALRLRTAARALTTHVPPSRLDRRIAAMAATAPGQWSGPMVDAARVILADWAADLSAAGFDPATITAAPSAAAPADGAAAGPAAGAAVAAAVAKLGTTRPAPEPPGPFVYDQTIDGLRGIALADLACVGDNLAGRFATYGLHTVYDLLAHVPRRYIDRSTTATIDQLVVGDEGTTVARVVSASADTLPSGTRIAKIGVADDTGRIECTYFNQPWRTKMVSHDDEVVVQGRLDEWVSKKGVSYRRMNNPLMDLTGSAGAKILPVYPQSKKKAQLTTWQIHRAAVEAVGRMGELSDPVPAGLVAGGPHLMGRTDAYRAVHAPTETGQEVPGRDRLAYDELLRMQLALRMRRLAEEATGGIAHRPTGALTRPFVQSLPFPLTGAQQRALTTISRDLRRPAPMHRLLQGDVGSGKTLVALGAMLEVVESGHQAALMAPTEVLATQHYTEIADRLAAMTRADGTPLRVAALTNKTRQRRVLLDGLADGSIDIVVGTHALLSDTVAIPRLGLAVVDEQHRFGVEQRAGLTAKGGDATRCDLLVMTATPIPRTAAMTVFGDLDVTVIDELPPGRTPIATRWHATHPAVGDRSDPVWSQVRAMVEQGRQAYVVCPLVEDSETKAAASAETTRLALERGALAGLRVGLVHGKQKPEDRDPVMAAFKAGEVDVLVATTVIEVGVNVPNAAMIVILEPKSFGMAQLHQLRGRVGRGQWASVCVLAGPAQTRETEQRLEALVGSTDGFELSEVDLRLRGPGSVLGTHQSGMIDLRVASLTTDRDLLEMARADAATLLDGDPTLQRFPGLRAEVAGALGDDAERWLTAS